MTLKCLAPLLFAVATTAVAQDDAATDAKTKTKEMAANAEAAAEAMPAKSIMTYNAILPEGKTLPTGVLRFRTDYLMSEGNGKSYDKDGNAEDMLMDIKASGYGFAFEYGLDAKTSLQLVFPYVGSFSVEDGYSDADIEADPQFKAGVDAQVAAAAARLQAAGQCPDASTCQAAVRNDAASMAQINGGVKAGFRSAIAAQEIDGETGLGDIEVGALYNVLSTSQLTFSVGGGLRLPTGKFSNVQGAPTGRGTTDLGLRLNLDYAPLNFLLVSLQNQSELMVMKGSKKVPDGTGGKEDKDWTREGVRNKGFLQLGFAAGVIHNSLKAIGLYTKYLYDYDAETRLDGDTASERSEHNSMLYGISGSGLDYGVPVSLSIESYETMSGKNLSSGTKNTNVSLKLYYQF